MQISSSPENGSNKLMTLIIRVLCVLGVASLGISQLDGFMKFVSAFAPSVGLPSPAQIDQGDVLKGDVVGVGTGPDPIGSDIPRLDLSVNSIGPDLVVPKEYLSEFIGRDVRGVEIKFDSGFGQGTFFARTNNSNTGEVVEKVVDAITVNNPQDLHYPTLSDGSRILDLPTLKAVDAKGVMLMVPDPQALGEYAIKLLESGHTELVYVKVYPQGEGGYPQYDETVRVVDPNLVVGKAQLAVDYGLAMVDYLSSRGVDISFAQVVGSSTKLGVTSASDTDLVVVVKSWRDLALVEAATFDKAGNIAFLESAPNVAVNPLFRAGNVIAMLAEDYKLALETQNVNAARHLVVSLIRGVKWLLEIGE